jgi:hypothetical protein
LDADYRPPIRRGDLLRAIESGYRFIGVIDGVFHQSLAVSVQEIRYALSKGAKIYGSSSMGALRAVETYPLGMIGVGKIYQWYRSETIDSDDEVAICFDEETGRALSEPLVNIRATLDRAVQENVIDPAVQETVLRTAIELPFSQRSYACLTNLLRNILPSEILERISSFFSSNAVDLKAEDAKALLRRMKEDYEE